jgi:hypothetical protein
MSLTFSKGHKQLAAVRGCRLPKLEGKIISCKEPDYSGGAETAERGGPTNYKLPDGRFCPVFSDQWRDTFYIFGMAGCGKSVLTGNLIGEYQLENPDNPVYIVSRKDSDEAFSGLEVQYVPVDKFVMVDPSSKKGKLKGTPMIVQDFEDLMTEGYNQKMAQYEALLKEIKERKLKVKIPPPPVEPTGCLIVYDDVDSMDAVSDELNDAVQKSIKDILNVGRSKHMSVIVTSHLGSDYKRTRGVLNECGNIVCFPRGSNPDGIKYVLKKYCALDPATMERVFKLPSRWVCVRRIMPSCVIYEGGCFLTNLPDADE